MSEIPIFRNKIILPIVLGFAALFIPQLLGCVKKETAVKPTTPAYVGGQACIQCHASETEAWKTSDHALAMQTAEGHALHNEKTKWNLVVAEY